MPNPAIQLSGCATSNDEVARFISRLRAVSGVVRVTLTDSSKSDQPNAGAASSAPTSGSSAPAGAATDGDCRHGSDRYPLFNVIVFFKPMAGAPAAATAPGAKPATTPAAPAAPAAGSSTPASAGGAK
jgi:hypothetical protein